MNPMVGSLPGCCARAASGHAAAPPSSAMKSRRFTASASRASKRKDSTAGRRLVRATFNPSNEMVRQSSGPPAIEVGKGRLAFDEFPPTVA